MGLTVMDGMADVRDPFEQGALRRLLLFIYLVPVFGMVPAMWTLTRRGRDRHHRDASRLALLLGLTWVLGTAALNMGGVAVGSEAISAELSLLVLNSLLTSGYFVILLGGMVRVWQRQPVVLPVLSRITKYMS